MASARPNTMLSGLSRVTTGEVACAAGDRRVAVGCAILRSCCMPGVSRDLTSLGPQPPHNAAIADRSPWSEGYDRIFRNEGVTGSNPVSSTKHSGQGDF